MHDRQHYQLVSYRRADAEQNYRRFFAVTELAGIRVEDPQVFDRSHAELLRWVDLDEVAGIRVDHPDGLADPAGYLRRLADRAPRAWLTVEKITEPGEQLPADWPVAGTTGYDALAELNGAAVRPGRRGRGQPALSRTDRRRAGTGPSTSSRASGWSPAPSWPPRSPGSAGGCGSPHRSWPAPTSSCGPRWSSWRWRCRSTGPTTRSATSCAPAWPRWPPSAVRNLAATITEILPLLAGGDAEATVRFEQATGAIMAKGVEDTAYYRYNRAIGLNEVGGDPGRYGSTLAQFHAAQQHRQQHWPDSMTTLSTHDTKRSEDVRARLAVLPELGDRWYATAAELLRQAPIDNPAFGYLLWQTFAGAGWIERDRMHGYAEKAMREAAEGTGWRDPDPGFEAAVHAAVDRAYDDPAVHRLLDGLIDADQPVRLVATACPRSCCS